MKIIFLSNQLFDYPLKTNKWHVATRVAKLSHDVLFIDPPIRFRKFLKQIFQGRWSLRRILTLTHQPQQNLTVYTPVGILPTSKLNFQFHIKRIKNSAKRILWVYNVEMENLEDYVAAIPHNLLIYDCVDNYPAFPRYKNKPELKNWIIKREEWLARKADIVFATTRELVQRLSMHNTTVYYTGNAGDYSRFSVQPVGLATKPVGLRGSADEIVIGFSGAIDGYKVNLPLLVKVAKTYTNHSLVLIGPTGVADDEPNLKELKSLPNVQLLGPKPYEEMPEYFSQFDVYIIPYNLNEYTLGGCFPVKFFDALAAGLPTVVTNLPCYKDFSEVCYITKDDDDFITSIKTAVEENSPDKISQRKKIAKQNSWDKKVDQMLKIVASVI